jgi:hypothetical protein
VPKPQISEEERWRSEHKARGEAWERAVKILEPWTISTRHMGSEELTLLMRMALEEGSRQANNARHERYEKDHSKE